ncbi:hypothetical protein NUW58_g8206 [Xylaria curta]|uniref:Uncharacterized protein n=1 Tax=Xylaria curta TaxID=42375 RepID=A0ACC1NAM9_9PEZI|nr:hypothetical protein NUW58_g8206 [Xylaria curta]
MVWDWGFNWQGIDIQGGSIGFNISGRGGDTGQGTGSVSIIDSSISGVPIGILTSKQEQADAPNIVLDNVRTSNVGNIVQQDGGLALLSGSDGTTTIKLWGTGKRYSGGQGSDQTGDITAPPKGRQPALRRARYTLDPGRSMRLWVSMVSLLLHGKGIANDGTGDQADKINTFLLKAQAGGKIAYFPAGIYQVGSTVYVPTGSRIQGAGTFFSDLNNPKVMVQVGQKGDVGDIEIVEMLFIVKGPTAGAVLMEWNVAAETQGSGIDSSATPSRKALLINTVTAAMWDSHFRVGGGTGTDLDVGKCPKRGFNEDCIAASLMFHITSQGSGYFENVWAWVADHDNDFSVYDSPDKLSGQVSIYGARGMLIESQGPSWFIGGGSEHSTLYNYQIINAKAASPPPLPLRLDCTTLCHEPQLTEEE